MIKVFSKRGIGRITDMILKFDGKKIKIPSLNKCFDKSYNIRFIFEFTHRDSISKEVLFGNKIKEIDLGEINIGNSSFKFNSPSQSIELNVDEIPNGDYYLNCRIYKETPRNNYSVLDSLPIPIESITFHFIFLQNKFLELSKLKINNLFDGFSYLGFFLADLGKMKDVIQKKYGNKKLDLVEEFSKTTLIDELFKEGIIMIVWGINPYTYPIISIENKHIKEIKEILGDEFPNKGIYKINPNINKMSIIPGHELKNWPDFLNKEWKEIELFDNGEKGVITPYMLKDENNETTICSFLITRENQTVDESIPLLNVDLLYS